jgi:hypothetical protein
MPRRRAEVTAITGDTVVLRWDSVSLRQDRAVRTELTGRLPITGIERMEVLAGHRPNILGGLKIGALIGALAGAGLGAAAWAGTDEGDWVGCTAGCVPVGALGGAFIGGIVGVLIGSMDRTDVWRPIRLAPENAIRAGPGIPIAGLAIEF